MPDDPQLERQLGGYGEWLEEHLHTGLRSEVAVTASPEREDRAAGRRWLRLVGACLAAVLLVALAAVWRDARDGRSTRTIQPKPLVLISPRVIDWSARTTTSPFGLATPTALAGGPAGFLTITRVPQGASSVWYSADGEDWSVATPPGDLGELESVAATTDALWLLARVAPTDDRGISLPRLYRTADGINWTTLTPDVLVLAPLQAAGDVLLADVMTDAQDVPALKGSSTNGQDWTIETAFPGIDRLVSTTAARGMSYALTENGVVLGASPGEPWQQVTAPRNQPFQLVGTAAGLVAIRDAQDQACIGLGVGSVPSEPAGGGGGCLGAPTVELLDDAGEWRSVPSSKKPMGFFPSPTVDARGTLVSAIVDHQAQLRVSTSSDLGATWTTPEVSAPVVIQQGNFQPLIATTGPDIVALATSVGDPATVMLVGHVRGGTAPDPSPVPTEAPGPTLPADATLPGATDPGPEPNVVETEPGQVPDTEAPRPTVSTIAASDVPLTITLRADDTTVVAGGTITVVVEVTNPRSEAVAVGGGCRSNFTPSLTNGSITVSPLIPMSCVIAPWQFQPGVTRIEVQVAGSFLQCLTSGEPAPDMPLCLPGNTPPPLPTGRYTLTIRNPIVGVPITPSSIEIEVVDP